MRVKNQKTGERKKAPRVFSNPWRRAHSVAHSTSATATSASRHSTTLPRSSSTTRNATPACVMHIKKNTNIKKNNIAKLAQRR